MRSALTHSKLEELTQACLTERQREEESFDSLLQDYDVPVSAPTHSQSLANAFQVTVAETYAICSSVDVRYRAERRRMEEDRSRLSEELAALTEKVKKREDIVEAALPSPA